MVGLVQLAGPISVRLDSWVGFRRKDFEDWADAESMFRFERQSRRG